MTPKLIKEALAEGVVTVADMAKYLKRIKKWKN